PLRARRAERGHHAFDAAGDRAWRTDRRCVGWRSHARGLGAGHRAACGGGIILLARVQPRRAGAVGRPSARTTMNLKAVQGLNHPNQLLVLVPSPLVGSSSWTYLRRSLT